MVSATDRPTACVRHGKLGLCCALGALVVACASGDGDPGQGGTSGMIGIAGSSGGIAGATGAAGAPATGAAGTATAPVGSGGTTTTPVGTGGVTTTPTGTGGFTTPVGTGGFMTAPGSGGVSSTAGAAGAGPSMAVTFSKISALIPGTCGGSLCHTSHQKPYFLNDSTLYRTLLDTVVSECGNAHLVTPGNPDGSAIIQLVNRRCMKSGKVFFMPRDCTSNPCLPASQIQTITDWIQAGAPGP